MPQKSQTESSTTAEPVFGGRGVSGHSVDAGASVLRAVRALRRNAEAVHALCRGARARFDRRLALTGARNDERVVVTESARRDGLRRADPALVADHVVFGAHVHERSARWRDATNAREAALVRWSLTRTLRGEENGPVVAALPLSGRDGRRGEPVFADLVERGAIVGNGDAERIDAAEATVGAGSGAGRGVHDFSVTAVRSVYRSPKSESNTRKSRRR